MGQPQQGIQSRISIGEEVTAGTGVSTTASTRLSSNSLKRALEKDIVNHLVGSGASAANPVDFFEVRRTVGGGVEFPAAYQGQSLGLWLKHALGSLNTTGSGPYAHACSLAAALPAGLTLDAERGVGASLGDEKFYGCKINQLELSVTPGAPMMCRVDILGMSGAARAGSSPVALGTLYPILHKHAGQLSFDSANYTLSSFTLRVGNNLSRVDELGSLDSAEPVRAGFQTIEIEAELMARSDALQVASLASTQGDVSITFTDGTRSLAVVLHNAVITEYSDDITGHGPIRQRVKWRGLGDGTDHGLLVTLTNGNSSGVAT